MSTSLANQTSDGNQPGYGVRRKTALTPEEILAESDRTALQRNVVAPLRAGAKKLGAAAMDVATLPGRAAGGVVNTAIRLPNSFGAKIPYIPESFFGGNSSSMTPYYDRLRGDAPQPEAAPVVAPAAPTAQASTPQVKPASFQTQVGAPDEAAPLTYNDQGLPSNPDDTSAGMSADTRTGAVDMQYGDLDGGKAFVTGTQTQMTAPAGVSGNRQTDGKPLSNAQAAGYDGGGKGFGVHNAFSAQDMVDINARIRNRVANGGANTFEAVGQAKTADQLADEEERFAQGTEVANMYQAEADAITAREAGDKPAAPDFTNFPNTFEGLIARKRAMQQYSLAQKDAESSSERSDRQAQLGVQRRIADANERNVSSQMQERGFGIQTAQRKAQQEQQVSGLRQKLSATLNPEERTALIQQINDLTNSQGDKENIYDFVPQFDDLGNRIGTVAGNRRTGQISDANGPQPQEAGRAKPKDLQHFLTEAKKVNPGMSDAELTAHYNQRYGNA